MTKKELARQYAERKVEERKEYPLYDLRKRKELTRFDGYDIEQAYEDGFDEACTILRNNVWHPASEKPIGVDKANRDILIVTMGPEYYGNKLRTWHIFSYMTWDWVKERAGEFEKWAYLEDILPSKKEN